MQAETLTRPATRPGLVVTVDGIDEANSGTWELRCAEVRVSLHGQSEGPFGIRQAKELVETWAAAGGKGAVVVVESGDLLRAGRVRSPERLLELIGVLQQNDMDLVVLEKPAIDTRRTDLSIVRALVLASEFRSLGRSQAVREWAQQAKQSGQRTGRLPKCSNCQHPVTRADNPGKGHRKGERTGRPGPCDREGCGCPAYLM